VKYKKAARMHREAVQCSLNMASTVDMLCKEVAGKRYSGAILSVMILHEQANRLHKVCNVARTGGG